MADPVRSGTKRRAARRQISAWRPVFSLVLGLGFVASVFFYMLRWETGASLPGLPERWTPGVAERERFAPLGSEDERLLQEQRELVAGLARRHAGSSPSGSIEDLRVLQQILDRADLDAEQTFELQALGAALGDVMAAQLGLHWVSYRDELGPSRALRLGETDLVIFPVTMISKRVEMDVPFRVQELYRKSAEEIARYRRQRRGSSYSE